MVALPDAAKMPIVSSASACRLIASREHSTDEVRNIHDRLDAVAFRRARILANVPTQCRKVHAD
jgi:hypothetical protein